MDFIVWMDYTSPHPEKARAAGDEEINCYIELPMEEGNPKLTDSEQYDGAVELRTVDEDQLVMTCVWCAPPSLKGLTRPWHRGIPARCRRSLPRMWRSGIKLPPVQGAVSVN